MKKCEAGKLALLKKRNPNNKHIRENHKQVLKDYKNLCTTKRAGFLNNQIEEIIKAEGNPDAFWENWREIGEDISIRKIPVNADGNQWENYFKKLYNSTTSGETFPPEKGEVKRNGLEVPFTMPELKSVIHNLKSKKSAGMDRIKNEFLKCSPENILQLILDMMNLQLKLGLVPKSWCIGVITPIHKEGPKTNPDNY